MQGESIPLGLCGCGCGERTNVARGTSSRNGHKRGVPYRYVVGHNRRKPVDEYEEQDRGYKTPCWIWAASEDRPRCPYGRVGRQGVHSEQVHRRFYKKHRGPIPAGLHLDHLCRVPQCVNPWHLEPVTSAENSRRGANAKLNWSTVTAIRIMRATTTVSQTEMAAMFGVSNATISEVVNYRIWQPERSFPDAAARLDLPAVQPDSEGAAA